MCAQSTLFRLWILRIIPARQDKTKHVSQDRSEISGRSTTSSMTWIGIVLLLAILAGSTTIRAVGMRWGVRVEGKSEPVVPRTDEGTFEGHYKKYPKYHNVYVPQVAVHALLLAPVAVKLLRAFQPNAVTSDWFIYQVGRASTILAGLAFLLLIFFGGRAFGLRDTTERVLATGLLAFSPLLSVYAHLFLADTLSLLWIYLSFWAFVCYARGRDIRFALLFALAAGFAGSTKFSTSYCVIPGLAILLAAPRPFTTAAMMAFVSVGAFWVGTGFTYDYGKLEWAHEFLTNMHSGSRISISIPNNLANQGAFFLSALGIPTTLLACGAFLAGTRRLLALVITRARGVKAKLGRVWRQPSALRRRMIDAMARKPMTVIYLGLGAQFLAFATSGIGGFFARHVIPFVPVVVFAAVRLASRLPWMRHRAGLVVTVVLLLSYQVVFCLDGERAFFDDPRQDARAWIRDQRPKKNLLTYYGPYSYNAAKGLPHTMGIEDLGPSPVPRLQVDHLLLTQQASYGRYLLADHCDKIQHCWGGEAARKFFVALVTNRSSDYRFVRQFAPGYFMFEHRLLERVVPNHPYPDLGRILVYRKVVKKPPRRGSAAKPRGS